MKKTLLTLLAIFSLIGFTNCDKKIIPNSDGMPNPAGQYASEMGYKVENNTGDVTFPDGSKCNIWSFFEGKCGQEWSYSMKYCGADSVRSRDSQSKEVPCQSPYSSKVAVAYFPDDSIACDHKLFNERSCGEPGE